jgi:hypothetical protein
VSSDPHHLPERAIDKVLDPRFVANLSDLSGEELRQRHELANEVERELSSARRSLHRILDLIGREVRSRGAQT